MAELCRAAEKHALARPEAVRNFSIVPFGDDPDAMEGDWREFPDVAARDEVNQTRPIYESIGVWKVPSGFHYVSTFSSSFSGDWAHYVDYCYRANGRLAWMEDQDEPIYRKLQDLPVAELLRGPKPPRYQ